MSGRKLTTSEFIAAATKIHAGVYEYKRTVYTGALDKVVILCRAHGYFEQRADAHLKGQDCFNCRRQLTQEEWKARKERVRQYLQARVKEVAIRKEEIRCLKLLKPKLRKPKLDRKSFIAQSLELHGTKYSYAESIYIDTKTKVRILCKKCNSYFEQLPKTHLKGPGCPSCNGRSRSRISEKEFLLRAHQLHGDRYSYSKLGMGLASAEIRCLSCGKILKITAGNFLHLGTGCQTCYRKGKKPYSCLAIEWIGQEARSRRMKNVQHALAGGEFRIPGTRIKVDGYHAPTSTVFEFYGDRFHGNPKLFYRSSKPNPFSDKTASQLYRETLKREKTLKELGFRVISIWEHEYRTL